MPTPKLRIDKALDALRIHVLLGESGSGKSALAKSIAGSGLFDRVVWFNNEHLNGFGLHAVSTSLGLTHDLTQFLPLPGNQKNLLVFDAVDKFSQDALRNAGDLINGLDLQGEGARWCVLITSQSFFWDTTEQQLFSSGPRLTKEAIRVVELPDWDELSPVRQAIPGLKPLMLRDELLTFLCNLKILDWVANAVSRNQPTPVNWIGVSNLIDWIWGSWVQTGADRYARAGLLQKLGTEEGVSFSSGIPFSDLTVSEQRVLADLEDLRLLRVENGRVHFTHDLLADWSRLYVLIGVNETTIPDRLRDRSAYPRWHHAIRLFGLRMLEQAADSSSWEQLRRQLNDGSDSGTVAADLVLEAAGFATNASQLLEQVWPHLTADGEFLVGRLTRLSHKNLTRRSTASK